HGESSHAKGEPLVGGEAVEHVGEVGGRDKAELVAGARAMLMPIRWEEPFGMVMVEALACGTPVIAFPEGAAKEIVRDGVNGFLVDDEAGRGAVGGRRRVRRLRGRLPGRGGGAGRALTPGAVARVARAVRPAERGDRVAGSG